MSTRANASWGLPKLTRSFVPNDHLAQKFDAWLDGSSVLLVQAPLGLGKTATVATWLKTIEASHVVIWISCGQWIRKWSDAVSAVEVGLHDTRLIVGAEVGLASGPVALASLLGVATPFVVVYDDFDQLVDTPSRALVVKADRQIPGGRTIVIRSKDDSSACREPFGVTILGETDLRWTEEMARAGFALANGSQGASNFVRELVTATEGHPGAILRSIRKVVDFPFGRANPR